MDCRTGIKKQDLESDSLPSDIKYDDLYGIIMDCI